jgi:chromosome segregation ATPase
LEKINLRYNSLSTNASQEDYIKALSEIENLTNNLEIVKQESQYQTIIQDVESKQADLETTLEIWSERLTGITKNEALKLSQEVSEQKNRFTQIESAQKVKEILEQLNPIILEISNEEETQARKQQQDSEIMQQLRQNNPKFLNTINLCQQGIEKITNLRSQLNYPERFNTEIEQLINALNNQVLDFQQQFENLKEQVDKIETDQQLSQLQTDLAKLDLIFKDSDDYSEYQQLLEVLKTKSIDRKNESQEEKIIDLFIQLPPERQQILYSKLGQHLSHNEQINE